MIEPFKERRASRVCRRRNYCTFIPFYRDTNGFYNQQRKEQHLAPKILSPKSQTKVNVTALRVKGFRVRPNPQPLNHSRGDFVLTHHFFPPVYLLISPPDPT